MMDRDLDPGHSHHADYQTQLHDYDSNRILSPRRERTDPTITNPPAAGHPYASAFANSPPAPNTHHDDPSVNPDDFYKNLGALPADGSDQNPMASSTSVPRPAIRPNGNSTPSRQPAALSSRSVSSPVDTRLPSRSTPAGRSVRDMAKRFDQANAASSTSRQNYSNVRNGVAGDSSDKSKYSATTRTQRSRTVAEDHVANNPQSFASRVGKPRSTTTTDTTTPKPAAAHDSRAQASPSAPAPSLSLQPLLFGEILPDQRDTSALGFGIESVRSSHSQSGQHHRSFSDSNLEPPSPADWYREMNTKEPVDSSSHNKPTKSHARSQSHIVFSGFTDDMLPTPQETSLVPTPHVAPATSTPSIVSSRLPLPRKAVPSAANPSSLPSTRSNSPSTSKRPSSNTKSTGIPTPTSRSQTPVTRSKTPTQAASRRPGALPRPITPSSTNGARLKAYIASPPPKLSPTLRSSRPRQPVSEATTASSRMRAADRAKSPGAAYTRAAAKAAEPVKRQRKISLGPIDFAQRREHIKLAYSKSVRESQAIAARKEAAEKRKKDMAAAANAKISAEAVALASALPPGTTDFPDFGPPSASDGPTPIEERQFPQTVVLPVRNSTSSGNTLDQDASRKTPALVSPLLFDNASDSRATQAPVDESPTLGVPGSFPMLSPPLGDEQRPRSVASVNSETTEFDVEPQTAPPVQAETPKSVPLTVLAPPTPRNFTPPQEKAEYQYPFLDDPETPEKSSPTLNAVLQLHGQFHADQLDITRDVVEPRMPGAFESSFDDEKSHRSEVRYDTVSSTAHAQNLRHSDADDSGMIPFPRIERFEESDECQSVEDERPDYQQQPIYNRDDTATDACTEASDRDERATDCGGESNEDGSTCDSSEVGSPEPSGHSGFDMQHTSSISNSLEVPAVGAQADRLSQQSTWTDLSVGSSGRPDQPFSPSLHDTLHDTGTISDGDESPVYGHATIFEASPRPQYESPSFSDHQFSGDVRRPTERPYDSARSSAVLSQHQFSDMDIGQGMSVPYASHAMSRNLSQETSTSSHFYMPRPVYEPPPVPTSAPGSTYGSRRTSAIVDSSQRGSTLSTSTRPHDEYVNILETPQTNDSGSPAMSDGYFAGEKSNGVENTVKASSESTASSDKERHRLVQRRNVIKELIDTEMVFVRDMNVVEEIYKGTAEACPRLDDQTVKIVFRNTIDIIEFHTGFLANLKTAVSDVYVPKGGRSQPQAPKPGPEPVVDHEPNDAKDRLTSIGPAFQANIEGMKTAHEGFLRNSDQAAKKLIEIQQDPGVKLWLTECNEVAKDLTAAWDLDSLLIKPMQRITKYPNIIITLLQHTPPDHPDREPLVQAKDTLETAIIEINKTKKNFELVGQIVGRKRKESDVRAGFARAFGKRGDKTPAPNKPTEDTVYAKLNEKFGDDYLRLQVVLRDVEFYTRQVSAYVHEFLQYLSSVELVMRLQPGSYPELESKWVQFNISVRDLEKTALEEHLVQVRKHVIEPFEQVIKAYGNPSLAMKKRQKRRLDYERAEQLKRSGKTVDTKLAENVEQYEALNDTLKKELPQLSALTEKIGNLCLGNFVNIQVQWYGLWKDKMKSVLADSPDVPDVKDIVATFQREFPYAQEQINNIPMLNPAYKGRASQSTTASADEFGQKTRRRPPELEVVRSRGVSVNGDYAPTLPTPDFARMPSGTSSFVLTPGGPLSNATSPHQYFYKDHYAGLNLSQSTVGTPLSQEVTSERQPRSITTRPSTGKSYESANLARQSADSSYMQQRDSTTSAYSSNNNLTQESSRYSGLFKSAMPMSDQPDDSQRASRASSRERAPVDGYTVLWLAASLFEFNINTTKHEAGYPYLVYQAGEIFDVIAEKGELWLAKNQDDPKERVGWIWSKHFAKLADS